jgi:hypothetical protein
MRRETQVPDHPPLPEEISFPSAAGLPDELRAAVASASAAGLEQAPILLRSLRAGCYLINYTPKTPVLTSFDGTIRVEAHSAGRTASGDLYQRPVILLPTPLPPPPPGGPVPTPHPVMLPGPNPANGIPVLARSRYRFYLRITQLLENFTTGTSFTLGFEMHKFTAPNSWTNAGAFTALMKWVAAPAGFPSSGDYLEGDVKNAAGQVVGRLTMGWVSKYFRKATVEIDRVSVSEAPLNNGMGLDWKGVFDQVGWDVNLDVSNANVVEPSGPGWSDAEMHAAMLARRDASNLDTEWRYHILAVRTLDSTPRGIMYDVGATDSNNVPREGVGISSHWVIPNSPPWGTVKGLRFGTAAAPYFRTVIHEIGHAFGLFHNTVDNGFMNTTDVIAAACPATFPACVKWSYASDDLKRLRHYSDMFVRPGATTFGSASTATPPISPTDLDVQVPGLVLNVSALLESLPIGAPVRVNLELKNTGDAPAVAPETISMKSGFVTGKVVDPSGTVRDFAPVIRCVEESQLEILPPGGTVEDSLTLLRGGQGALFPMPGAYRIQVLVSWEMGGAEAAVLGETALMVTGAQDVGHAEAALKVLSTPDTVLTLALGGDHLKEGIDAIQTALKQKVLRPHFAWIEAKRLAQRFGKREADLEAAANLIDEETTMSAAEYRKAQKILGKDSLESRGGKKSAGVLKYAGGRRK